jgi:methylamine dehydrogenase accessory protein MauD
MNTMLLISYLTLWGVVLLLVFALAVLARQIGVLHERVGPKGARMTHVGPEIGEVMPARLVTDMSGRALELGGTRAKPLLLTFMSATCQSCSDVAPALRALWKNERKRFDFAMISVAGTEEENREFVARFELEDIPYVFSRDLGMAFKVLSPPYSLLLDTSGAVKAKGLVNRREHLESLLNAAEMNAPTMETYMAKQLGDPTLDPMLGLSK